MMDIIGRPLAEGDVVAFVQVGHSNLVVGSVCRLTPKGATILSRVDGKVIRTNRHKDMICLIQSLDDLVDEMEERYIGDFDP